MKTLVLAALAATLLAAPAFAQTDAPPSAPSSTMSQGGGAGMTPSPAMQAARAKMREMCAADLKTFCADKTPGPGGGLMQCVRDNAAKMSDPCKAALAEMQAARSGA